MPPAERPGAKTSRSGSGLSARTTGLKQYLEAFPGAAAVPVTASNGTAPLSVMFKIMGKMFAVLSLRGDEFVVVKCEAHLAEALRAQYKGIGHRTHLDPRHWIAIELDADVPKSEIERLAASSYALASSSLTRKQRAELAALRAE